MAIKHWSTDAYRALGLTAPDRDGPYALEANPNRNFSTSRSGLKITGIVLHITVGLEDYVLPDHSADGTQKYGATTSTAASWHVCLDSDGISPAVRDAYSTWHAGVSGFRFNQGTLGIEIAKRTTDWRTAPADWVARTLRNAAIWAAPRVIRHGIPLTVVRNRDEVNAGILANRPWGFTQHGWLAPHNRTDAGLVGGVDTFPWSQFFGYLAEEIAFLKGAPAPVLTLRKGDRGEAVKALQVALLALGYDLGSYGADGSFGAATDAAVRAFQAAKGLTVDGVVGADTRAAMGTPAPAPAPVPAPAPAPVPAPAPTPARLSEDGSLGPATIRRWQAVMGTPQDGTFSDPSSLTRAVQRHLNAKGAKDARGLRLAEDGKGLAPNTGGRRVPRVGSFRTIEGLQRYLGTPIDGYFSGSSSTVVKALQARLNSGGF